MSKPMQAFPAVGQQAPAVVITLTAVRWDGGDEMMHPGWWVVTAPTGERWVADPATMERLYGIREVQP